MSRDMRVTKSITENAIDYRFKILYALGMIMVVLGHAYGGGIAVVSDWFPYAGLHLSMFMFCSGYFYKYSSEENIGRYIWKKIKSLIIPLYIYNVIYGLLVQLLRLKGFDIGGNFTWENIFIMPITNGHQFAYNMGGWFIVPLFMVQVFNICLRKLLSLLKVRISEIVYFIISIALGILGNWLACLGYLEGGWLVLVRMLHFIPFYGLGIFYKNIFEKWEKRIPGILYFAFVFTAKLIIACAYGKMPTYNPSWCNGFTEGPIMPIIVGYLGIAFWLRIVTIIEPAIGKNKYVNLIADNTYSIMMNQFLGFMIIKTVYAVLNKFTLLFADFDWISYKTDIWYYYKLEGLSYTLILYTIAGIVFPIIVQKAIDLLRKKLKKDYMDYHKLICQCCGMPLEDSFLSKEPDDIFSEKYCK